MDDYISRQAAIEAVEKCQQYKVSKEDYAVDFAEVKTELMMLPTADVVEVVRCKDCRWGKKVCGNIECSVDLNLPSEYHGYDWYCPNGERADI